MSPDNSHPDGALPPSAAAGPPVICVPPPQTATPKPSPVLRQLMAIFLSLYVGLFLVDAIVSLVDDSLILFLGLHLLTAVRATAFLAILVMGLVIYVLMGLAPMIPKRWLIPLVGFVPLAGLIAVPLFICHFDRAQQISWALSLTQVLFGFGLLFWMQGGFKFRWLPITENQLGPRLFSWLNLLGYGFVNVCVVLPAVAGYLALCSAASVKHLSAGFVVLKSDGVTVQVRDYLHPDGKRIQLIPMAHIGEAHFYRELSDSFATNAIVLMEGVTDARNLLTNKISYRRMATSMGLAEQAQVFRPDRRAEVVPADVDVEVFTPNTIGFMNLVMLIHARGVSAETVLPLFQYAPPPQFEKQLWDDLLHKRNRHLLEQIQTWLPHSEQLIVPWGAAHMPEIAREIEKLGFRLDQTRDYQVIRFRAKEDRQTGGTPPSRGNAR